MSFMNRLSALAPRSSRTRVEGRSPRRSRAAFRLEMLEDRDLKSGVSLANSMITIEATQYSGNSAHVFREGNDYVVTLNGAVAGRFGVNEVYAVAYRGGAGGGDTFVSDTDLYTQMYGYGGRNHFTGSSSFNIAYLYGDNNSYGDRGGGSYVFSYDGPNDNVALDGNNYRISYSTDLFYFI